MAHEHAHRPRSCCIMLRHHMLIVHVDRMDIMKKGDFVHALCARATFYACKLFSMVLQSTSYGAYMCACVLRVSYALGRGTH